MSAYDGTTPDRPITVVRSPTDPDGDDATAIASFVRAGGTLLVAADYGDHGNALLATVGADARVNGTPLRDEQHAGPSPAFPRAQTTPNHTYTERVDGLMLNHGSVVEPGNATVIARSSEFSYLDTNRNQQLDESEVLAQRPVVTVETVGEGTVIVVSDPSLFLNAMRERSDNAAFLEAIVENHEHVLLDVSHGVSPPPLVTARVLLQRSGVLGFLGGSLSVLALVVLAEPLGVSTRLRERRRAPVQQPQLSADEIAAGLRARHPEWDEARIDRVTESLLKRRRKEGPDD